MASKSVTQKSKNGGYELEEKGTEHMAKGTEN
jgi:hypothetical protein